MTMFKKGYKKLVLTILFSGILLIAIGNMQLVQTQGNSNAGTLLHQIGLLLLLSLAILFLGFRQLTNSNRRTSNSEKNDPDSRHN